MSEAAALRQSGATPLRSGDPDRIGPYVPLALLGSGGMGRVFLGRDVDGDTGLVAVKVIRPEYADDPNFRRRFEREASVHAQVRTPHAPRLCGTGFQDELLWMATEYLPAVDLADAVREGGALEPAAVWRLVAELGRALADLAAAEIVHRDLKPSNVLLTVRGAHVIDFGLSKAVDASALTGTGNRVGTPAYMSPEHLRTGTCTTASDIFSLAGTLVYALKGRAPFGDGTGVDVMHRVAFEEPNAELLGEISATDPELGSLLSACLTKEPERRPTPRDLVDTARAHTGTSDWPEPLHGQVLLRQRAYDVLRRVPAAREPHLRPPFPTPAPDDRPKARPTPDRGRTSRPAASGSGAPAGAAAPPVPGSAAGTTAPPVSGSPRERATPAASGSPEDAASPLFPGSPTERATPAASWAPAEKATPAASGSPADAATPLDPGSPTKRATPAASWAPAEKATPAASGSPADAATPLISGSPAEAAPQPASGPPTDPAAAPAATPAPAPHQSPTAPARPWSRKKPALTVAAGITVCAVAAGVFVIARQDSPAAASAPGARVTTGGTVPGGAVLPPGFGHSGNAASPGKSADGAASVDGGASRAQASGSSEAGAGAGAGAGAETEAGGRATPSSGAATAGPGAPTAAGPAPSASATDPATPPWISDCTYYNGSGHTQQGDSGKRVLQVQCMLTKRGYSVGDTGVDGEFGPGTESAVRGFQSDKGLGADGVVGRETWSALRDTT